ncbi:MAG: GNAT family N-acetyltransferase [Anaerovoracaceae bacterium]|nr:GNAT family N-acetyltransferase [Bacillota bacterium]MDY2669996.1 GNAT family N-acetyltransferase [Anaerovoracaceae bacterium]
MEIRLATTDEMENVRDFYFRLISDMANMKYQPAWKKAVYPSDVLITDSIKNGELYVVPADDEEHDYMGAMIMNREYNFDYSNVKWSIKAEKDEIEVIHLLGVPVVFQGQGIATFMVEESKKIAKEKGARAIRLDVLDTNLPAHQLYQKAGFAYVDSLNEPYEDGQPSKFLLYEYVLD